MKSSEHFQCVPKAKLNELACVAQTTLYKVK